MNKCLVIFSLLTLPCSGQSFEPAAGQPGSTAIWKDSSVIVGWASGIQLQRGYLDISNTSLGFASYGSDAAALGHAEGDGTSIVSLGDLGSATLTFQTAIMNGPGPDFAVFENGFADNYMEFAHVEVSSDGINFARFPSVSETPLTSQIDNFMFGDCRYVHNLAGKYRQGYGTPFDLDELNSGIPIDLNHITHVRLIDVVGSVDAQFGTLDSQGKIINDPYPTNFDSGGFDLDAVAVLNAVPLEVNELISEISVFPNPAHEVLNIKANCAGNLRIITIDGKILFDQKFTGNTQIDLNGISTTFLIVEIQNDNALLKKGVFIF
jgi:hypothetical protein